MPSRIAVQRWIDGGGLKVRALTPEGICEIHRRFGELLPDALLWVEDPDSVERMHVVPGGLRARDVRVGQHVAISPGACPVSWTSSKEPTAASARQRPSSRQRHRTTGCCGYTRFLTATGAWRG